MKLDGLCTNDDVINTINKGGSRTIGRACAQEFGSCL